MTNKDIFEDAFPQDKQIGGSHYKDLTFNPTNLYQRMIFRSFRATL